MAPVLQEEVLPRKIRILAPETQKASFQSLKAYRPGPAIRWDRIITHPFWIFFWAISLGVLLAISIRFHSQPIRHRSTPKPKIADHFNPTPVIIRSGNTPLPGEKAIHPANYFRPDPESNALPEKSVQAIQLPQVKAKSTDLLIPMNPPSLESDELDLLMIQLKNLSQSFEDAAQMNPEPSEPGATHAAA